MRVFKYNLLVLPLRGSTEARYPEAEKVNSRELTASREKGEEGGNERESEGKKGMKASFQTSYVNFRHSLLVCGVLGVLWEESVCVCVWVVLCMESDCVLWIESECVERNMKTQLQLNI